MKENVGILKCNSKDLPMILKSSKNERKLCHKAEREAYQSPIAWDMGN